MKIAVVSLLVFAFAEPQVAVAFDDDGRITETRPAKREIRIVDGLRLLPYNTDIRLRFRTAVYQALE